MTKNVEDTVVFLFTFSIDSYKKEMRKSLLQRTCIWKQIVLKKNKKTWIYNSYLIRQSFWGYRCELDIAIFCKGTNEITHTVLLNTAGTVFPIPDVLSVYFWIYNIDTSRYEYFPNQGLCYTIYTLVKR